MKSTGVESIIQNATRYTCELDNYLIYAEFMLNILPLSYLYDNSDIMYLTNLNSQYYHNYVIDGHNPGIEKDLVYLIVDNIKNTLDKISHRVIYNKKMDGYEIVPKDGFVLDAATVISYINPHLSDDILNYGHHSLKGDLKGKAAILNRLYIDYEEKRIGHLIEGGYKTLTDDIGFIANNFGIRHGKKDKGTELVDSLNNNEKEEWYDTLFALFISAIQADRYLKKKPEIKKFRDAMKDSVI